MSRTKRKIIIMVSALLVVLTLAVLFVPYSVKTFDDGGTKEYRALAYIVVKWNRLDGGLGIYQKTEIYWFPDSLKNLDELWRMKYRNDNVPLVP